MSKSSTRLCRKSKKLIIRLHFIYNYNHINSCITDGVRTLKYIRIYRLCNIRGISLPDYKYEKKYPKYHYCIIICTKILRIVSWIRKGSISHLQFTYNLEIFQYIRIIETRLYGSGMDVYRLNNFTVNQCK